MRNVFSVWNGMGPPCSALLMRKTEYSVSKDPLFMPKPPPHSTTPFAPWRRFVSIGVLCHDAHNDAISTTKVSHLVLSIISAPAARAAASIALTVPFMPKTAFCLPATLYRNTREPQPTERLYAPSSNQCTRLLLQGHSHIGTLRSTNKARAVYGCNGIKFRRAQAGPNSF